MLHDSGRGPQTQIMFRRTDRKPWPPQVLAKLAKSNTVQCEVGAATQRLDEHSEADVRITPRYDTTAPQPSETLNSRSGICCCCGDVLGNASFPLGGRRGHGRNEKTLHRTNWSNSCSQTTMRNLRRTGSRPSELFLPFTLALETLEHNTKQHSIVRTVVFCHRDA